MVVCGDNNQVMGIVLGNPAQNLEKSSFGSRGVIAQGALGEKKVAGVIEGWASDKPVIVGHSLRVPGQSGGDTDHIIASGNVVLLVDAKKWKSGYSYSMTRNFSIRRAYGMKDPKGRAFKAGKVSMPRHIEKWSNALGEGFSVAGLIVVASEIRVVYDENWKKSPFKIVPIRELREVLDILFPTTSVPNDDLARLIFRQIIQ